MENYTERYFEEIAEDESATIEGMRTVTEADVVNFAGVSGDFSPLHTSKEYARNSAYSRRVPHGNLIFAITEGIAVEPNRKAIASYGHDNLRYVNSAAIGDTLTVQRDVIGKEDYSDDAGKITYKYETLNQDGKTLLVDHHDLLVEKEP